MDEFSKTLITSECSVRFKKSAQFLLEQSGFNAALVPKRSFFGSAKPNQLIWIELIDMEIGLAYLAYIRMEMMRQTIWEVMEESRANELTNLLVLSLVWDSLNSKNKSELIRIEDKQVIIEHRLKHHYEPMLEPWREILIARGTREAVKQTALNCGHSVLYYLFEILDISLKNGWEKSLIENNSYLAQEKVNLRSVAVETIEAQWDQDAYNMINLISRFN